MKAVTVLVLFLVYPLGCFPASDTAPYCEPPCDAATCPEGKAVVCSPDVELYGDPGHVGHGMCEREHLACGGQVWCCIE